MKRFLLSLIMLTAPALAQQSVSPTNTPQVNSTVYASTVATRNETIKLSVTAKLVTVSYSATPSFNAANGNGFDITLIGNVTASTFINGTSGATLVAIRVTQDSVGGRTFAWPKNARNAGMIDPAAGSTSTQLFMRRADGSLDAAAPIMWSTPAA
jgi:hypothetical protein